MFINLELNQVTCLHKSVNIWLQLSQIAVFTVNKKLIEVCKLARQTLM